MHKLLTSLIFLLLLLPGTISLAGVSTHTAATEPSRSQLVVSGEVIAGEISRVTGVAISPILGISVLGAYTYYTTQDAKRNDLPWHARPLFWGPLLLVLTGIILKDTSKIGLPKILVIPLDAAETLLEKNVSAVLGILVILSSVAEKWLAQTGGHAVSFPLSFPATAQASEAVNTATATAGTPELLFLSLVLSIIFWLVWVVSQSFNFLIFLSPSSWLDLILTGCKNTLIVVLLGACLINPYLGLMFSILIILSCLFLFARSFRFVIFGTILAADLLFRRASKAGEITLPVRAFGGSSRLKIPSLSYGSIEAREQHLVFRYRPWLILPAREGIIPRGCARCDVGTGTLSPVIITDRETGRGGHQTLFRLRPLYRGHEEQVAKLLGLRGVRDVAFGRSIRDGYRWLLEQLSIAPEETEERITG